MIDIRKSYHGITAKYTGDKTVNFDSYRNGVTIQIEDKKVTLPIDELYRVMRVFLRDYQPTDEDLPLYEKDDSRLKQIPTPLEKNGWEWAVKTPKFFKK